MHALQNQRLFLFFFLLCTLLPLSSFVHAVPPKLPPQFLSLLKEQKRPLSSSVLVVSVAEQKMVLFQDQKPIKAYKISTAKNGIGQKQNSYQTPAGLHLIAQKIGHLAPSGTIFTERKVSGQVWDIDHADEWKNADLVLTRILWLEGLEPGFNQGKLPSGEVVDSMSRYIYIHGTHHEEFLGSPMSKGCIRMKNSDIVELFDLVKVGTLVYIMEKAYDR